MAAEPTFYFDFNSPYAYLAAERVGDLIPHAEWRPIAFPILLNQLGRLDEAINRNRTPVVAEVKERLAARGMPPFSPAEGWPVESWSLAPLRAAVFAADQGRISEFSLAAFRKTFVDSLSLIDLDNVLKAAEEAGLDPDETQEAIQRPEIKQRLKDHTDEAFARGVPGIPTVALGDELFWGDDHLEEAAAAAART